MLRDGSPDTAVCDFAVDVAQVAFGLVLHAVSRVSAFAAHAHAGNHVALMLQKLLGDSPALVLFAHEVRSGNPDIVEKCFAEWRRTADQLDWFCGHAIRGHVKKQETDAFMLR